MKTKKLLWIEELLAKKQKQIAQVLYVQNWDVELEGGDVGGLFQANFTNPLMQWYFRGDSPFYRSHFSLRALF